MIAGIPVEFALESEIRVAYERPALLGLGFFAIHLGGVQYGVRAADATLLACSYDAVKERIDKRGTHRPPFSELEDAGSIADAFGRAQYADEDDGLYLKLSRTELVEGMHSGGVVWAPDGDEAFDDGSCVLHFDVGARVRLIGFRRRHDQRHDPDTLRDVWLASEAFYRTLQEWKEAFDASWNSMPKSG